MRTILILILASLPFLAMYGCTTTGARDSLVVQTAFRYTLVRYVERADDPVDRAQRIVSGAERVLHALSDDKLVTVQEVRDFVREQFSYSEKPLFERMLIDDLLLAVESSLEEAVEQADMPEDTKVRLIRVISTAQDTARSYLQTYGD